MPERVIAIGDIHGCADALAGIVKQIVPTADDTLILLGDCIDRGPDSRGVIKQMLALADQCKLVPILGNHEEMFLSAVDRPGSAGAWLECGGRETLESYGVKKAQDVPREDIMYMRTWVDYWENSTHFFVHGNYDPLIPLEHQEWGFQRWESIRPNQPKPHRNGKTALVGHTPQKTGEILDAKHLIGIDTYCHGGKWLTALDVTCNRAWQVSSQGHPRTNP